MPTLHPTVMAKINHTNKINVQRPSKHKTFDLDFANVKTCVHLSSVINIKTYCIIIYIQWINRINLTAYLIIWRDQTANVIRNKTTDAGCSDISRMTFSKTAYNFIRITLNMVTWEWERQMGFSFYSAIVRYHWSNIYVHKFSTDRSSGNVVDHNWLQMEPKS